MKALSLFANIGVAEAYFKEIGIDVVIANEIDEKRVAIYKNIYPKTEMIQGDITNLKTINKIVKKSLEYNIELIIATPPCQGMSTAGKMEAEDERNALIFYAIKIIKLIKPKYVLLENVPMQLKTNIKIGNKLILIPDYIEKELGNIYNINKGILNTADYGVPQTRERAIFTLVKKEENKIWEFPKKHSKIVTLKDAIGDLPILDPLIYDLDYKKHLKIFPNYEINKKIAEEISPWHIPPKHIYRQVNAMRYTPTGQTAFKNIDKYKPVNADGKLVKGYLNTYKRQSWNIPAFTVTMYNRTISSQNNVHPGREVGIDKDCNMIYSDPRVLTVYELMLVMSIPKKWNIPEYVSEHFIRAVIGEGIPPLFMKQLIKQII
jgi:DNA (cytosine-5)-methyltransferase 1